MEGGEGENELQSKKQESSPAVLLNGGQQVEQGMNGTNCFASLIDLLVFNVNAKIEGHVIIMVDGKGVSQENLAKRRLKLKKL